MKTELTDEANHLTVQRLIRHYLSPLKGKRVWTVEDACITTRRVWSRYGIPADAACWWYVIEHPEQGWSMSVRAVWRNSTLMFPIATHTTIEGYSANDATKVPDDNAARAAANEWLCSLPL